MQKYSLYIAGSLKENTKKFVLLLQDMSLSCMQFEICYTHTVPKILFTKWIVPIYSQIFEDVLWKWLKT